MNLGKMFHHDDSDSGRHDLGTVSLYDPKTDQSLGAGRLMMSASEMGGRRLGYMDAFTVGQLEPRRGDQLNAMIEGDDNSYPVIVQEYTSGGAGSGVLTLEWKGELPMSLRHAA